MKTFLIEHILSLFTGKDLNPGQMKLFFGFILSGMVWLSVSQSKTEEKVNLIQAQVADMPEIISQHNNDLAQMMYADAQRYSAKVIECIIKANTDILFQLDISEKERDKAIRAIESRFDGVINDIERLQNQDKYIIKMMRYRNNDDTTKIQFRKIGGNLFDRPRSVKVPIPYWGAKVWQG